MEDLSRRRVIISLTKKKWTNWSGAQKSSPDEILFPKSEEELIHYLKNNPEKKIRIVGSGHSFSPLVPTDSILISLDKMQGIINIDRETKEADVWAGTKLYSLTEKLHNEGLALINMGDIDRQSIAGALCSGTHGTGASLRILSDAILEMTLVTPQGEILHCNREVNSEIFNLAQVNLGLFGIVTRLKIKVSPKYKIHFKSSKESLANCLILLEERITSNRHYEFFWFPYTQTVQSRMGNITELEVKEKRPTQKIIDEFMENNLFEFLSQISKQFSFLTPTISKMCAFFLGTEDRVNYGYKIFPNLRDVKFQEMELSIPVEHVREAIIKIDKVIKENAIKVHFPIEVRFAAADEIALSPCYQRESCFIAFHMYKGMPYKEYFKKIEDALSEYNCRPHWGKMSCLGKNDFEKLYPKFNDFCELRKKVDPEGKFLNNWLREIFG